MLAEVCQTGTLSTKTTSMGDFGDLGSLTKGLREEGGMLEARRKEKHESVDAKKS